MRDMAGIELHLHHGKTRPDTLENLRETLDLCLRDYARIGIAAARPAIAATGAPWSPAHARVRSRPEG